jgi:hypothetical protein
VQRIRSIEPINLQFTSRREEWENQSWTWRLETAHRRPLHEALIPGRMELVVCNFVGA